MSPPGDSVISVAGLASSGHNAALLAGKSIEQAIQKLIALLHAVGHAGRDRAIARLLRSEINQRRHRGHAAVLDEGDRDERIVFWKVVTERARVVRLTVDESRRSLHVAKRPGKTELAAVLV